MERSVHVLVTNDDGIDSAGLVALAGVAHSAGLDVTIAAPTREYSGASAAITLLESHGRVVVEERELPGLDGVPTYAVAASPAFIVLVAMQGGFGPIPDLVMSGVNYGANVGRAVSHSGTVGAALTAALDGRRAAAFAVGQSWKRPREPRWDTVKTVAAQLLPTVYALPPGVVLNVNVPDVPYDDLRGIRQGSLATFGSVQLIVAERNDGYLRMSLSDNDAALEHGTDEYWLSQDYVTLTPIRPIGAATDVDLSLDGLSVGGFGGLTGSRYPGQST